MAKEVSAKNKISFQNALKSVLKGIKTKKQELDIPPEIKMQLFDNQQHTKTVNFKNKDNQLISDIRTVFRKSVKDNRIEVKKTFVKMFIHTLIDELFEDKKNQLTESYLRDLYNYAWKNYFNDCRTMKAVESRYYQYKYRIEIAKKLIENRYKDFDKTFFYPLAYLQVEKKGNKHFSFQNTERFWKQKTDWEQKNGYNRKLTPQLRKRLNSIARSVEIGTIDYDSAVQKIKNMTKDSAELLKQFETRIRANVL